LGPVGPPIEASSINQTQQSRFHLRTREKPSLETLWFKNIRAMDEVQITDPSSEDPSFFTLRSTFCTVHYITITSYIHFFPRPLYPHGTTEREVNNGCDDASQVGDDKKEINLAISLR
jgi:hypothetical protein